MPLYSWDIWKKKIYNTLPEIFDADFGIYIRENWKRYLDDCFIFWTKTQEDLQKFHSILNNLHESIQFTMEASTKNLPFLDLFIVKEGNRITTDLYSKETDTHQYLDFRSCHPSHTKRNIPYNMARRICTIITDSTLRKQRLDELKIHLTRQHYPENLIDAGIQKAEKIPISELRKTFQEEENTNNNVPFVVTHNPRNHNILNTAKRFFPLLEQSTNMKNLLNSSQIINSRRQAPSLKKLLTRANFSSDQVKTVKKCGDPRCGTCEYIEEGGGLSP